MTHRVELHRRRLGYRGECAAGCLSGPQDGVICVHAQTTKAGLADSEARSGLAGGGPTATSHARAHRSGAEGAVRRGRRATRARQVPRAAGRAGAKTRKEIGVFGELMSASPVLEGRCMRRAGVDEVSERDPARGARGVVARLGHRRSLGPGCGSGRRPGGRA